MKHMDNRHHIRETGEEGTLSSDRDGGERREREEERRGERRRF